MKKCNTCLLPETHETIFYQNKSCNICKNFIKKKTIIDWKKRKIKLDQIINHYKSKKNDYDCIIPFSGGKDSSWIVYFLKKNYNINPLLVRYDHHFFRKNVNNNVEKLLDKLSVDIVSFRSKWEVVQKLMLKSLIDKGDFCWHCHTGIYNYPIRVALEKKIPLIIWGEGSGEYEDYYDISDIKNIDENYQNRVVNLGITAEDMYLRFNGEIEIGDLKAFTFPSKEEFSNFEIKSIALGDYVKWDVKKQVQILKKDIGWKGDAVENVPPEYDYEKIECYMQGVRDYIKYIKRGYSRVSHLVSLDLRNKRIKKKRAQDLIKLFEGKRPKSLDLFLNYTGLSEAQFNKIIKSHIVTPNKHNFQKTKTSSPNPDHKTYSKKVPMNKKYTDKKMKEWI